MPVRYSGRLTGVKYETSMAAMIPVSFAVASRNFSQPLRFPGFFIVITTTPLAPRMP